MVVKIMVPSLRVQVPDYHIFSKIVTYTTSILNLGLPNYWVLWTLRAFWVPIIIRHLFFRVPKKGL